MALSEPDVTAFLKQFVSTYEKGDASFFKLFADDVSVFSISVPTRIDGAEEFKRGFDGQFKGTRRSQILSPEIRIAGDMAVVTYHNRVAFDSQSTNMRSTLVLQRLGNDIKIVHLHNSPLASPGVVTAPRGPADVTLLEERVATAAAAVGTPK
ncbi:nuclear transport factor 2 family protein [Bradyrhizobium brasilense]|uniref:nuclear transport factor 2 family protein n=1 Tax=Bradyrhizobium brasilense TaxID=1419277 RepID=UPI002877B087|nr:nuclear transport factor 2 family protein [Bradyrhizobium brasilense]MCP3417883.1 nuclear transport factor 2 family protein [Bradyrhizobium brasilense]